MSNREESAITRVHKRGEMYTVEGVSKGTKSSFHVDACTLESMSSKESDSFMRRTIRNMANTSKE